MFTDQERLQRKREMARLRQARKRARDRERQSLGRDSLGSGMELDPADIPEGRRSESGDHSTLNQGTDDELDEDEVVGKGSDMMGLGQNSRQRENGAGESSIMGRGESRGKGVEVVQQSLIVPGMGPMQLHPDHDMQSIAAGTGTPIPNLIGIHPQERIPTIYNRPRIPEDITVEDEDADEEGDNHAIIWPWLRRTVRLIESSRGDRKMQEDIYTVLYTDEMARMLYDWESTRPERPPRQQSELKERTPAEARLRVRSNLTPVVPLDFRDEEDKEPADEVVDELLGHLEERVQAIKKQKGLKAEVQSLKRDLIDKEKQLKEYNAIVDTERATWQAERAGVGR